MRAWIAGSATRASPDHAGPRTRAPSALVPPHAPLQPRDPAVQRCRGPADGRRSVARRARLPRLRRARGRDAGDGVVAPQRGAPDVDGARIDAALAFLGGQRRQPRRLAQPPTLRAATSHGSAASEPAVARPTRAGRDRRSRPRSRPPTAASPVRRRCRPACASAPQMMPDAPRARRRRAASCPVRRSGRGRGSRRPRRGSSRCPASRALPPVMASDRCTPTEAGGQGSRARRRIGRGRPSPSPMRVAAGSWTSIQGQPASARASEHRPGRRPRAARSRSARDDGLDEPLGPRRGRPPGARPDRRGRAASRRRSAARGRARPGASRTASRIASGGGVVGQRRPRQRPEERGEHRAVRGPLRRSAAAVPTISPATRRSPRRRSR